MRKQMLSCKRSQTRDDHLELVVGAVTGLKLVVGGVTDLELVVGAVTDLELVVG